MREVSWPELQRSAQAGDAAAQRHCALAILKGSFGKSDPAAALRWLELSAAQKHGPALNNLGELYATGECVPVDHAKALAYFEAAWSAGEPMGLYNQGILSEYGTGRPQDTVEAIRCFRLAAQKGCAAALCRLSAMHHDGDFGAKDAKQAVAYARQAAEKGSAEGWYNLAVAYRVGEGVAQDRAKALECAQKSWDAGLVAAAPIVADLLVELHQDYAGALAYLDVYRRLDRSPEVAAKVRSRTDAWGEKLESTADRERFVVLSEEQLPLEVLRRQSREIFGR